MPDPTPPARVVALGGRRRRGQAGPGLQAHLGDRLTVVVNTGDDIELHGLPSGPTTTRSCTRSPGSMNASGAGGSRARRGPRSSMLGATARRRGSGSATATSRPTSSGRPGCAAGERPTEVATRLQAALGRRRAILPMTDEPVRTEVLTDDGWLEFQDYFVRRHQEPTVHEVRFRGVEEAAATPEVLAAFERPRAIVVAPSNPIVSIGPILAVAGHRAAIAAARSRGVPVVAVSGIVGGKALKGPADRMLVSLGHESSALGVARLYAGVVDVFVIDTRRRGARAGDRGARPADVVVTDTIMADDEARARVAGDVLAAAARR